MEEHQETGPPPVPQAPSTLPPTVPPDEDDRVKRAPGEGQGGEGEQYDGGEIPRTETPVEE